MLGSLQTGGFVDEGARKVWRVEDCLLSNLGFRGLGFRVQVEVFGFRESGQRIEGLGFRDLGVRVLGCIASPPRLFAHTLPCQLHGIARPYFDASQSASQPWTQYCSQARRIPSPYMSCSLNS